MKLEHIREDYQYDSLDINQSPDSPFSLFELWIKEALEAQIKDATGMGLVTVSKENKPSSRIVLLKEYGDNYFIFYTNYHSRKGTDISINPQVSLHFFWSKLERQIRISGTVSKVPREKSIAYFYSRPRGSQIGALVSDQSKKIGTTEELELAFKAVEEKYKDTKIPCPKHWGGYSVEGSRIEFWQGKPNRLHDRIVYELEGKKWQKHMLAP